MLFRRMGQFLVLPKAVNEYCYTWQFKGCPGCSLNDKLKNVLRRLVVAAHCQSFGLHENCVRSDIRGSFSFAHTHISLSELGESSSSNMLDVILLLDWVLLIGGMDTFDLYICSVLARFVQQQTGGHAVM